MDKDFIYASDDGLDQEDRCRRALKTVAKAIAMRIFVLGILGWVALRNGMSGWVIGILVLVGIINLTGIAPLYSEWKKQRRILREIIEADEV